MRRYWLIAGAICAATALLEAGLAGNDPVAALRSIRQPPWSPSIGVWALIGSSWYAICFVGLARLLRSASTRAPRILLLALMVANASWSVLIFQLERFDIAFWSLMPYAAILAALLRSLWLSDRVVRSTP
jgi:hypothetical protein